MGFETGRERLLADPFPYSAFNNKPEFIYLLSNSLSCYRLETVSPRTPTLGAHFKAQLLLLSTLTHTFFLKFILSLLISLPSKKSVSFKIYN